MDGVFFRTAWIGQYFNEARDDGVAVASAGPYTNYLHLTADK